MTEHIFLGKSKDGKQVGLFKTHEDAFRHPNFTEAQFWNLDDSTGQYFPSNGSVCKFDIVPTKE